MGAVISIIFTIIYFVAIFFLTAIGIVMHILRGLAIYKMSAARGIKNGWLGFIPCACDFQLGQLAGEIEFGNKRIKNTGLWLLLMPIICAAAIFIGYLIILLFSIRIILLGSSPVSEEFTSAMPLMIILCIVYVIILIVTQVFLCLLRGLALHKIFSRYSNGQKLAFYLIIALFVPYAEHILLYKNSMRPSLATGSLNYT
ncbi:MAG: hypothetical protein FWE97_02425 [Dehalococcoidia bacterium]|nr:hypothetical protein [Dehalococcoidia bacterium]